MSVPMKEILNSRTRSLGKWLVLHGICEVAIGRRQSALCKVNVLSKQGDVMAALALGSSRSDSLHSARSRDSPLGPELQ